MGDFSVKILHKPENRAHTADILFVHGLGGDWKETWQHSSGAFWPDWLSSAMPRARILSLSHPSSALGSLWSGAGIGLIERSRAALELLQTYDVGQRPTIYVTHSLGGLIVKAILRKARDIGSAECEEFVENTAGMIFLATPHSGSGLASILGYLQVSSKVADDLKPNTEQQKELQEWYVRRANQQGIPTKAFFESLKTKGLMVVDQKSANPGTADGFPIGVDTNHIDICKFENEDNSTYRIILKFIRDRFHDLNLTLSSDSSENDANYYSTTVEGDRKSLEEKLELGGRGSEIDFAKREKERLAKALHRNATSTTALEKNKEFLGDIVSRFWLHVFPYISQGQDQSAVNQKLQEAVIDKLKSSGHKFATQQDIHAAVYYLTGNCHIAWSEDTDD